MSQHCYPTCFMSQQGYRNRRSYIATQGPLAETTDDFWRLLWENNSTIVVMLTKLREMGRVRINASTCECMCACKCACMCAFVLCMAAYMCALPSLWLKQ